VARPFEEARRAIDREGAALAAVRRVASAEREYWSRRARDRNGDGVAEYGSLEDLVGLGLVPAAAPPGYRLDVLLPVRALRDGRRTLRPAGPDTDPVEASRLFVALARPLSREDGLRSFSLDARGALYAAEGIVDSEAWPTPPLPEATFDGTKDDAQPGPIWRILERGEGGPPAEPVPQSR
jgi:hypothetical protein